MDRAVLSLFVACAVCLAVLSACASSPRSAAAGGCFFVAEDPSGATGPAATDSTGSTPRAVSASGATQATTGGPAAGTGNGDETGQLPGDDNAAEEVHEPTTIREAIEQGHAYLKFRIRGETVNQSGLPKDAQALTVRSVLGYETAALYGFSALVEVENVSRLGAETYNDTYNGKTNRPVIADPTDTEVNQAYLQYVYESTTLRGGRQVINLDNQRFIGAVAWRQNEQTFDAVSAKGKIGGVDLFGSWLSNANRVFGDDSPMGDARQNSWLANAKAPLFAGSALTGYFYYLDFNHNSGLQGVSTGTYGARYTGAFGEDNEPPLLEVLIEVARQQDVAQNPARVRADYAHYKLSGNAGPVELAVGYESLGGSQSGNGAFSTPLATLHAFNGWADKFLTTPATGLEDTYVSVGGKLLGNKLLAVYHEFRSEASSADYGDEIDLAASRAIDDKSTVGAKYANYDAHKFATDTDKFWLWYETRF